MADITLGGAATPPYSLPVLPPITTPPKPVVMGGTPWVWDDKDKGGEFLYIGEEERRKEVEGSVWLGEGRKADVCVDERKS